MTVLSGDVVVIGGGIAGLSLAAQLAPHARVVLVEAEAEGFSITREGIAMGDAAPGARFLVKVDDAKQPVQAMATADGRATLPGWAP